MNVYAKTEEQDPQKLIFNMLFIFFVTIFQIIGLVVINRKKIRRIWKETHYSETILAEVIGEIGQDKTQKRKDIVKAMKKGAVEGLAD